MVFDYENSEELKQLRKQEFKLWRKKKQKWGSLMQFYDETCACTVIHQKEGLEELKREWKEARQKWAEKKQEIIDKENPHVDNREYFSKSRSVKVPLRRRHPLISV